MHHIQCTLTRVSPGRQRLAVRREVNDQLRYRKVLQVKKQKKIKTFERILQRSFKVPIQLSKLLVYETKKAL